MKRGLTIFARGVVYLVGIAALAVCTILLPELAREEAVGKPINATLTYFYLVTAYILATPFFVILYQALEFLSLIDRRKAFSNQSVKILQNIKICAVLFSVMTIIVVIAEISLVRSVDLREDVTFMITIGFVFAFVSGVIAVSVAVLQKLLADAVALKSENDLIV